MATTWQVVHAAASVGFLHARPHLHVQTKERMVWVWWNGIRDHVWYVNLPIGPLDDIGVEEMLALLARAERLLAAAVSAWAFGGDVELSAP